MESLAARMAGVKAERCRRSFYYFFKTFWGEIEPVELVDNWHIKYLCVELQTMAERVFRGTAKDYDLIINIPPSSTKTTITTIMFPAWVWARMPEARIMSSSYSGFLSTGHAGKSRDVITSDRYQEYFPYVEIRPDYSGKGYYMNTAGGERLSTSVTGTITGKHFHFLLVDDPINTKQASSEKGRLTANNFMTETLPSRKVDRRVSVTVLIMQRLHVNDPTGHLLDRDKSSYRHICLPAEVEDGENVSPKEILKEYEKRDGLLDPVRLPRDVLEQEKINLGSYGYAGQMLQRPAPREGGIWKTHYIRPIRREHIPENMKLDTDWDLAYTAKEKNSASAWVTTGVYNKSLYIVDLGAVRLEFPELIKFMYRFEGTAYIEDKASGKSAKQTLMRNGVNAVLVPVNRDKIARTRDATPYAEAGRVFVAEDLWDYLFHDTKQGIIYLTESNSDIDLNDALVQAINRKLGGIVPKMDALFDDPDLMRGR